MHKAWQGRWFGRWGQQLSHTSPPSASLPLPLCIHDGKKKKKTASQRKLGLEVFAFIGGENDSEAVRLSCHCISAVWIFSWGIYMKVKCDSEWSGAFVLLPPPPPSHTHKSPDLWSSQLVQGRLSPKNLLLCGELTVILVTQWNATAEHDSSRIRESIKIKWRAVLCVLAESHFSHVN